MRSQNGRIPHSSIFSAFYAFFAVLLYYVFPFDKIVSGKRYICFTSYNRNTREGEKDVCLSDSDTTAYNRDHVERRKGPERDRSCGR